MINNVANPVLYFCMINSEDWKYAEEVMQNMYDYVDYMIMVYGGDGSDGSIDGMRKISKDNMWIVPDGGVLPTEKRKAYVLEAPWCDNFPAQRQKYLDVIRDIRVLRNDPRENSWVIVSDGDEYFSPRLIKRLRKLIKEYATPKGLTMLKPQCRGVTLNTEGDRISENLDEYHKELIYKWHPDLRIVGVDAFGDIGHGVHEGFNMNFVSEKLPNNVDKGSEYEILYEHRKTEGIVWEHAHTRNYVIGGGGPNLGEKQLLWQPFLKMLGEIMPATMDVSMDYRDYLKEGNINERLKRWLILHMFEGKKDKPQEYLDYVKKTYPDVAHYKSPSEVSMGFGYDGASEIFEGALLYFTVYHPEECPDELKPIFRSIMA